MFNALSVSSSSVADWPLSSPEHLEPVSLKVPVWSSEQSEPSCVCVCGPGSDIAKQQARDSLMSDHEHTHTHTHDPDGDPDLLDPEECSDSPHSFKLCPPRSVSIPCGAGDCTSSSFDIVFEDSGCHDNREDDGDNEESGPKSISLQADSKTTPHDKAASSGQHTPRCSASASPPRPSSLALGPSAPPLATCRPLATPKVRVCVCVRMAFNS